MFFARGRGEHVGRRALGDLRRQRRAGAEAESLTVTPGLAASNCLAQRRERLGERRGREHRHRPGDCGALGVAADADGAVSVDLPRAGRATRGRDGGRRDGDEAADGTSAAGQGGLLQGWDVQPEASARPGISTTTFVALTAATASTAGLEPELVGGLPAHQRDEAVRSGLDLDLGHHCVPDDSRDQAADPVTRRFAHDRGLPQALFAAVELLAEAGEHRTIDGPTAAFGRRRKPAGIGPAADGVVADPQQIRGFPYPK